jgi:mRNA interferase RelE/StbE
MGIVKTIALAPGAAKDLDALPPAARDEVERALDRYAMTGQGDVKRLQGREAFRLRVGQYRVIFNEDQTLVLAIYIGRRDDNTYARR